MRNDFNDCAGRCGTHGEWSLKIQFIGGAAVVSDACPICNKDAERDEIYDEGFASGRDEGCEEVSRMFAPVTFYGAEINVV